MVPLPHVNCAQQAGIPRQLLQLLPLSARHALQERFQVYSAQTTLQIATLALQGNTRIVPDGRSAGRAPWDLLLARSVRSRSRSALGVLQENSGSIYTALLVQHLADPDLSSRGRVPVQVP